MAVLVSTCLACSGDDDGSASETSSTSAPATTAASSTDEVVVSDPEATFVEGDCWWSLDGIESQATVTCGTVEVPADWSDPDAEATITLPLARVSDPAADPDASPVVVLHGGPGGDALSAAPIGTADGEIVKGRDVVFYDQRGSGRSTPSLNCPEREEAVVAALTDDAPFAEELAANAAAAEACRDRLVGEGIDLDLYDTPASINDLEAIRVALGADTVDLRGGSYGTRLGLAYARAHPERVRSLTLDSVYPVEVGGLERAQGSVQAALDRLFAACEDDAACAAAYPDLATILDDAVAALDAEPGEVTATVTVAGEEREEDFRLVGADFRSGMFAAMYQNDLIPALPGVVADMAAGTRDILAVYIDTAIPLLTGLSEGAYFSIDCADGGRLLDGATAEDVAGDGTDSMYTLVLAQTYCDVWDVEPVAESFNEPALPDVPTLVFGGTLDPVTPHADSEAQAAAMPDARFVSVPRGGHGVAGFDECTAGIALAFLDDPTSTPSSCTADIEPLPFGVPQEG